jgi:hypothetical protein
MTAPYPDGVQPVVGGLEKLSLTYWQHDGALGGPIEALFNPQEISRTRTVSWQRVPRLALDNSRSAGEQQFLSAGSETLAITLFFDTYEPRRWAGNIESDVSRITGEFVKLAEVDRDLHRPPLCHLSWGTFSIFTGVLTSLTEQFTMFRADGTPVRATLACAFAESPDPAHPRARELNSADVHKTRVLRSGDTLHSLAAEEYGDPAMWRHIALANGILNPRSVPAGTVLALPKLDQ